MTHPSLRAVTEARVELDIRISAASNGDFYLHFLEPGWTDPPGDTKYRVGLYPVGSDNSLDNIRRVIRPVNTTLVQTATVIAANTWHHVDVTFAADHVVAIAIDGTPHLTSPPDSMLAGPFDIVFDFFKPGDIDNVRVSCLR